MFIAKTYPKADIGFDYNLVLVKVKIDKSKKNKAWIAVNFQM